MSRAPRGATESSRGPRTPAGRAFAQSLRIAPATAATPPAEMHFDAAGPGAVGCRHAPTRTLDAQHADRAVAGLAILVISAWVMSYRVNIRVRGGDLGKWREVALRRDNAVVDWFEYPRPGPQIPAYRFVREAPRDVDRSRWWAQTADTSGWPRVRRFAFAGIVYNHDSTPEEPPLPRIEFGQLVVPLWTPLLLLGVPSLLALRRFVGWLGRRRRDDPGFPVAAPGRPK